ncbi:MAG: VWA domain-containing protein, partial [Victivallales bacterium]|nr:VWA domain-containing protein [Victivallales bacterium]
IKGKDGHDKAIFSAPDIELSRKALSWPYKDDPKKHDDNAETIIPATRATAAMKEKIVSAINAIRTGGSTALFAGVAVAANEIRKNAAENYVNRIILLSDGLANVGPSTPQELGRLGRSLIKEKISVSTIGVGSDYNEDLMTALSQNSDGNFYFVENSRDLPLIFSQELGSALRVAATAIRVRIVCPEGVRPKGILGHECRINGNTVEMDFNQVYIGHEKSLILQVETPPRPAGASEQLATVTLDYAMVGSNREQRLQQPIIASFSTDRKVIQTNLNRAVQAEIAVQQSAVMRENAVKLADKGDFDAAQKTLQQAAVQLEKTAAETGSPELRQKAATLQQRRQELVDSKHDARQYNISRKRMKGESYQVKNSQVYQQTQAEVGGK